MKIGDRTRDRKTNLRWENLDSSSLLCKAYSKLFGINDLISPLRRRKNSNRFFFGSKTKTPLSNKLDEGVGTVKNNDKLKDWSIQVM